MGRSVDPHGSAAYHNAAARRQPRGDARGGPAAVIGCLSCADHGHGGETVERRQFPFAVQNKRRHIRVAQAVGVGVIPHRQDESAVLQAVLEDPGGRVEGFAAQPGQKGTGKPRPHQLGPGGPVYGLGRSKGRERQRGLDPARLQRLLQPDPIQPVVGHPNPSIPSCRHGFPSICHKSRRLTSATRLYAKGSLFSASRVTAGFPARYQDRPRVSAGFPERFQVFAIQTRQDTGTCTGIHTEWGAAPGDPPVINPGGSV